MNINMSINERVHLNTTKTKIGLLFYNTTLAHKITALFMLQYYRFFWWYRSNVIILRIYSLHQDLCNIYWHGLLLIFQIQF